VREEEKQVDGPDLERAQEQETHIKHEEDERLPDAGEQAHDIDQERSGLLLGAMGMILDKQHLAVSALRLPQREARALEALQAAVSGRTANTDRFVYAEDRRSLLEQSLAVLQPNLAGGDKDLLAQMHDQMAMLTRRVSEIRNELEHLEEAQEELLAHEVRATDAKPKSEPTEDEAPEAAPKPPTSLGDPADLAAAAKQLPWWRRPLG